MWEGKLVCNFTPNSCESMALGQHNACTKIKLFWEQVICIHCRPNFHNRKSDQNKFTDTGKKLTAATTRLQIPFSEAGWWICSITPKFQAHSSGLTDFDLVILQWEFQNRIGTPHRLRPTGYYESLLLYCTWSCSSALLCLFFIPFFNK